MGDHKTRVANTYKRIFREVSEETGIPVEDVSVAYRYFWKFFKRKVSELPMKEEMDEETYRNLRTSCNIPQIGKLNCTWDRFQKIHNSSKNIKEITNNRKNGSKTD